MTRVLVPVRILSGEGVSAGLIDLLGTFDVTVLGYHVLPEQTPPDQARLQYEDRATAALDDLIEEFESAGGAADYRLVFTNDRQQTVNRVADELGARAFAIPGTTGDVDNLLVSLSGAVAVDRILTFVVELVGGRDIDVTLLLGGEDDGRTLETAAERLRDAGIGVDTRTVDGSAFEGLVDGAPGHDAIVMGEAAPSLQSFVFGDTSERVAAASVGPVLVVRSDEADDAAATAGED